jgi:hypothetical protein
MNQEMFNDFGPNFIAESMEKALHRNSQGNHRNSQDNLAYLFATGKNELYLRDLLAIHLHNTLDLVDDEFVGREWRKHDLSINNGNSPLALIEGKSYIHYDAANDMHLEAGKNTIKHDLEKDLAKCELTRSKLNSEVKIFFTAILFTVDVRSQESFRFKNLTYGQYHRQGIKKFGSLFALRNKANSNLENLLSRYGKTARIELQVGQYRGLYVVADFHVLQIN